MKTFKEYENIDKSCEECIFEHEQEGIYEAEYQGKKVKLGKPFRTPDGPKKRSVYVKNCCPLLIIIGKGWCAPDIGFKVL